MKKKTSPIWKMNKQEFQKLVNNHVSYTSILKEFGFGSTGGPYRTLKQRIQEESIDCSHILVNNVGRTFPERTLSLEEVMIENSTYSRGYLKKRLLRNGTLENKCEICGQKEIWNNQKLIMVLDHKNGVNNDHRKENLRMLCPNCNSQQKTFAGRKSKKYYHCKECDNNISRHSKNKLCKNCSNKIRNNRKVKNRPSKEQLLLEIKELGYRGTGRKYGVSDNAVRKWLK